MKIEIRFEVSPEYMLVTIHCDEQAVYVAKPHTKWGEFIVERWGDHVHDREPRSIIVVINDFREFGDLVAFLDGGKYAAEEIRYSTLVEGIEEERAFLAAHPFSSAVVTRDGLIEISNLSVRAHGVRLPFENSFVWRKS